MNTYFTIKTKVIQGKSGVILFHTAFMSFCGLLFQDTEILAGLFRYIRSGKDLLFRTNFPAVEPRGIRQLVIDYFAGFEEQFDFVPGRLGAVRSVNEVISL